MATQASSSGRVRLASYSTWRLMTPTVAVQTSTQSRHSRKDAGTVPEQHGLSFAGLLRQLRAEARLTQEELAEAAGLSPRSVSDLERGINRTARKDTALLLAGALGLSGPVGGLFVAAARGRAPADEVLAARQEAASGTFAGAATRTLPRDVACFTGRQAELARLLEMLTAQAVGGGVVGIHAIGGMAGVGKTSFAVHAAHRLAGSFPDGQFFLPLHAHTPGRRPVDAADALASLLLTVGVPASLIPPGLEARSARWRDQVAGKKILLLLDDAAGHEQVRPLLPGSGGSLVQITSRRRLPALEDVTVVVLDTLPVAEAAELLVRLAARPGLRAADAAVDQIARLCGYLPLAIAMPPASCGTTPPGPLPNWPPAWPRPATGWLSCMPRTCRSRPRSTFPTRTWPLARRGCSAGSAWLRTEHRRLRCRCPGRHEPGRRPSPPG